MELVIVWGTSGTESSVAYLVEHQTYNLGLGFYSHQNFGQWSNFLVNLLNLLNDLLSKLYKCKNKIAWLSLNFDFYGSTSLLCNVHGDFRKKNNFSLEKGNYIE